MPLPITPHHLQDTNEFCGAATAMMILHARGAPGSSQPELFTAAREQPADPGLSNNWAIRPGQLAAVLNGRLSLPEGARYEPVRLAEGRTQELVVRLRRSLEEQQAPVAALVVPRPQSAQHWVVLSGTSPHGFQVLDPWPLSGTFHGAGTPHSSAGCTCHHEAHAEGNCEVWVATGVLVTQLRGARAAADTGDGTILPHVFGVLVPGPVQSGMKKATGVLRRAGRGLRGLILRRGGIPQLKGMDAAALRALLTRHRLAGAPGKARLHLAVPPRRLSLPDGTGSVTFAVLREGAQWHALWLDGRRLIAWVQPENWPGLPEKAAEVESLLRRAPAAARAQVLPDGGELTLRDAAFTVESGPLLPPEPAAVHPGWPCYRLRLARPGGAEKILYASVFGCLLTEPEAAP